MASSVFAYTTLTIRGKFSVARVMPLRADPPLLHDALPLAGSMTQLPDCCIWQDICACCLPAVQAGHH